MQIDLNMKTSISRTELELRDLDKLWRLNDNCSPFEVYLRLDILSSRHHVFWRYTAFTLLVVTDHHVGFNGYPYPSP
jgi:hypothetical protein